MTPLIYYLPKASLASIVIFALRKLFNVNEFKKLYNFNRFDSILWLIAFIGTLFFGVIFGMAIAVSTSLIWLLHQQIRPGIAILGVLPGTTIYRNIKRFEDAQEIPHIRIFRFGSSLHFANKDYFEIKLKRACKTKILKEDIHKDNNHFDFKFYP